MHSVALLCRFLYNLSKGAYRHFLPCQQFYILIHKADLKKEEIANDSFSTSSRKAQGSIEYGV